MNSTIKFTKEKEKEIIRLYTEENKTQQEIGFLYNTYNTSIRRVLKRNNINLIPSSKFLEFIKYEDFLNKINTPDFYYFLGLLATDGCITKNRIILDFSEENKELLIYWNEFLDNKCNINISIHSKYKTSQYRIAFRNTEICKLLNTYGITKNKSFTLKLNILNWDVIRGILDGDGYIIKSNKQDYSIRIGICSASLIFIEQLNNFFTNNNIHSTITKSKKYSQSGDFNFLYAVNIYKLTDIFLFYNLCYNDAKYFLKRKYLKFGPLVEKFTKLVTVNSGKETSITIIPSQALLGEGVETLHSVSKVC